MLATHLRLSSALLALTVGACGDSDSGAGDASVQDGGGPLRFDAGGFPDGAVPGELGAPCAMDSECHGELACLGYSLPGSSDLFGFCNKPCATTGECASGELCASNTGRAEGLHCVQLEGEEYGLCGPLLATECDGRACLLSSGVPVGFCIDICSLDPASDADAGLDDGADAGADGALACRPGQSCIDGVLSSPTEGLCGTYVDRGETCAVNEGRFCGDADVCAWSDPKDSTSELRCFESCASRGVQCAEGSCVIASGIAYCR